MTGTYEAAGADQWRSAEPGRGFLFMGGPLDGIWYALAPGAASPPPRQVSFLVFSPMVAPDPDAPVDPVPDSVRINRVVYDRHQTTVPTGPGQRRIFYLYAVPDLTDEAIQERLLASYRPQSPAARSGSSLVPDARIDVPMPAGAAVPGTESEIERLRKALDREIAWRKTAIAAAKAMARRDALREAHNLIIRRLELPGSTASGVLSYVTDILEAMVRGTPS